MKQNVPGGSNFPRESQDVVKSSQNFQHKLKLLLLLSKNLQAALKAPDLHSDSCRNSPLS